MIGSLLLSKNKVWSLRAELIIYSFRGLSLGLSGDCRFHIRPDNVGDLGEEQTMFWVVNNINYTLTKAYYDVSSKMRSIIPHNVCLFTKLFYILYLILVKMYTYTILLHTLYKYLLKYISKTGKQ